MREIVREPAVAGRFYPANPERLREKIESYLSSGLSSGKKTPAIACIVPHAGYMYSGQVAAAVFSRLELPASCIVLGPNHTGRGHPLAIMTEGTWRTPLGEMSIDSDLAKKLIQEFPALSEDSAAHRLEHSIEVEIPFLQVRRPGVEFVPITIGTGQLVLLEQLGTTLAEVLKKEEAAGADRCLQRHESLRRRRHNPRQRSQSHRKNSRARCTRLIPNGDE